MGKRGPKKKPTKVLEMRNSRHAAGREGEPQPQSEIPPCPDCLSGEAEAEWHRIVPALDEMLDLGAVDRGALVAMCQAWEEYRFYRNKMIKEGVAGPGKGTKRAPYVMQMNTAYERWLDLAKEYGCTPASRAELGAMGEGGKDTDPTAKYFQGENTA